LQIAHANVGRRAAREAEEHAVNQEKLMRARLYELRARDWVRTLDHYAGMGKEAVFRVVFHNVSRPAGEVMCSWLRHCENWSGGCAFIDEKGETKITAGAYEAMGGSTRDAGVR
jgi:hypothetical protein